MINEAEHEEIFGVFFGSQVKGRWTESPCILYFTTRRLIVRKEHGYLPRTGLGILLGRTGDGAVYIRHRASARDRLKWEQAPSADELVKADPENFEIPYSDISAVELRDGILLVFGEDLDTPKHRFRIARKPTTSKKQEPDFEDFLRAVLPDKV